MADYNKIIDHVLKFEGGFAQIKGDVGGRTIFGIAENFWPQYWRNGAPSKETAKNIFYKNEFWDKLNLDQMKSQLIANEIFDSAINIGHSSPVKWLQIALNILIFAERDQRNAHLDMSDIINIKKLKMSKDEFKLILSVDGDLGPNTLTHTNYYTEKSKTNEVALYSAIDSLQSVKYLFESQPNVVKGHLAQRTQQLELFSE